MSGKVSLGDVVVLEHPFMCDEHIIGRIAAPPTKSTVMVEYWNRRRNEWSDEPRRRKATAIVGRIAGEPALTAARLQSANAELTASINRARASYARTIRSFVEQDPRP